VVEGGYIAPPTIYTETKAIVEVFVKTGDCKEIPVTIGHDLAIREGHNVVFISAWDHTKNGFWVASYNETTDIIDYFADPRAVEQVAPLKQKIDFKIGAVIFIIIFVLASLFHAAINTFIILLLIVIGMYLYNKIIVNHYNAKVKLEFEKGVKNYIKDLRQKE